ncbi:MAG: amidase domain-containing protein [Turicibacter sp.]|nr:amidase domain-containing protein [Turicibacter sp.]
MVFLGCSWRLQLIPYDREAAVAYARRWALARNPIWKDYEKYGGNCTNFASQVLHAGGMPFVTSGPHDGFRWYWFSDSSRSPSWTSARYLKNFILGNNAAGKPPRYGIFAYYVGYEDLEPGDIVLKYMGDNLTHTMIVTQKIFNADGTVQDYLISQNSYDLLDYPLSQKDGQHEYVKVAGYYV